MKVRFIHHLSLLGGVALVLAGHMSARAEIVGDFEAHRPGVTDDRSSTNAFLGSRGKGWLHNWIFGHEGAEADGSGVVKEENPLEGHGGKYVQVTTTAGPEKASVTLYRCYEEYDDVSPELPRTIRFFFRLDSELVNFDPDNSINFSEDRKLRPVGGAWWISAMGGHGVGDPIPGRNQEALIWSFYSGRDGVNFSGDGFVRTGMALEPGVSYQFEVTVDPTRKRWRATISNGKETVASVSPENPADPWLNFRDQAPARLLENPAGYLLFSTALVPGNTLKYSFTGLTISPPPEELP